jgi:hypothetical protein
MTRRAGAPFLHGNHPRGTVSEQKRLMLIRTHHLCRVAAGARGQVLRFSVRPRSGLSRNGPRFGFLPGPATHAHPAPDAGTQAPDSPPHARDRINPCEF